MGTEGDGLLWRVLAAVIRHGGSYLIAQRPLHKRHGGLWEFPGGKVEGDESDDDAMARELREELGVQLAALGEVLFERRDEGSRFVIVFREVVIEGEPDALEHSELRWADRADLLSMPLAPSDRAFVLSLHERAPA